MTSTARLFTDACAARRWHRRENPRGVVPADLEEHAIRARYLSPLHITAIIKQEADDVTIITFLDGSAALRTSTSPWEVIDVEINP